MRRPPRWRRRGAGMRPQRSLPGEHPEEPRAFPLPTLLPPSSSVRLSGRAHNRTKLPRRRPRRSRRRRANRRARGPSSARFVRCHVSPIRFFASTSLQIPCQPRSWAGIAAAPSPCWRWRGSGGRGLPSGPPQELCRISDRPLLPQASASTMPFTLPPLPWPIVSAALRPAGRQGPPPAPSALDRPELRAGASPAAQSTASAARSSHPLTARTPLPRTRRTRWRPRA